LDNIHSSIEKYYTEKINRFGVTPKGVDWNGEESQLIRFQQMTKIIDNDSPFSINDLGCGYGKLVTFLKEKYTNLRLYRGYDLSAEMISAAKAQYDCLENISFYVIEHAVQIENADYTVASGIFNVKMEYPESEWLSYILKTIDSMSKKSTKGFAFNLLTKYSDAEYMKNSLYYSDPCFMFDYCKRNFTRNVALLHDYDLYEYTILVRK
jgi:SAM-dependent methyltransferase